MQRQRLLLAVVACSVGSGALGYVAASRIEDPDAAAANAAAPDAAPVTATVDRRVLESRVVARGDVVFDGSLDVEIDASSVDGLPLVTSTPLAPGDRLAEGAVLAEIAGRPVVVLGGELPTYRSLAPGAVGPDVAQLEAALVRLGHDPGTVDDTFDPATSAALDAMYAALGYPAPDPAPDAAASMDAARVAVGLADDSVLGATRAVEDASGGPSDSERLAADAAVDDAKRELHQAHVAGDADAEAAAAARLEIASAQRRELLDGPDTTALRTALADAEAARDRAHAEFWDAAAAAATPLPAAEVAFVPSLPRRVGTIGVQRGQPVEGPIATITGVDLVVRTPLGSADRALVTTGMPVLVEGGGVTADATLTSLADDAATGSAVATVTLDEPSAAVVDALTGLNVKVTIPVETTDGAELVVPLAALTAGSDGGARVEVIDGEGVPRLVAVTPGLVADGHVAVRPAAGGSLAAGDAVVVGR